MASPNRQYESMLTVARERLSRHAPESIARRAGVTWDGGRLTLPSLGQTVTVTVPDFAVSPELDMWHALTLLHYLDLADGTPLSGKMMAFAQYPDGMVRGGLTYSDRCTPQQQSYTVLSPDNDRAAIKLVTGNAHNRRFIYRFTGWRVSGSDMVLRPGRVIDLDTLGLYMDPITHEITLNAVWTPFADGTGRIETVNFFVISPFPASTSACRCITAPRRRRWQRARGRTASSRPIGACPPLLCLPTWISWRRETVFTCMCWARRWPTRWTALPWWSRRRCQACCRMPAATM